MWDNTLRNIRVLTIVTFLLVLATGILSISSVRKVNDNIYWALHTKDILQLSDELYASLLESESNLRGYSLSMDKSFITEYSVSKALSLRLLDSLKNLTIDNNQQQKELKTIEVNIIERIKLLDSILATVREYRVEFDQRISEKVIKGKQITQKIKVHLQNINQREYVLLQGRNKGLYRNLNLLPAILLFTTLTGLGAGALLIYSLFQYNRQKKESDKQISDYQLQLKDQIQRLNDSNKELEQFAYVASHDLQEPLRKISAFSDLLKENFKDQNIGEGQLFLDRIIHSSARMRDLITDLLNYSRVSRNTNKEQIDLNTILDMVKEDLEILINEKEAVIKSSNLPTIAGNSIEFRQLFQNLISNSLKFLNPNKKPIIIIETKEPNPEDLKKLPFYNISKRYVSIHFIDNGIGFDENYAEKIFVIFQRLHGKDIYEGTGIGLAICKKIVEKYGGVIFANSNPGHGANFTVILPISGLSKSQIT